MVSVKVLTTSLPFPPFNVNAYIIRTEQHRVLFDSTIKDDRNIAVLTDEIKKADGIDTIILSHGHLDHAGAASILASEFDVPIYTAIEESERISSGIEMRMDRRINKILKVLDFFGFDKESTENERKKLNFYKSFMEPIDFFFNIDSFTDEEIEIIKLPGHTAGSIGIFAKEDKLLFSGDALLSEGISAFLDVERLKNSLNDYLLSLERVEKLKPKSIYQGHFGIINNVEEVVSRHKNYVNTTTQKILDMINSGYTIKEIKENLYSKNHNILIILSEVTYALQKCGIPIFSELSNLLKD